VIAWDEFGDAAQAIFARLYDAGGNAQGTGFEVSDTGGFASFDPEASADASGNLVVSWFADAPFSPGRVRIIVRRFAAAPRPPAPVLLGVGNATVTRPLSGAVDAVFSVNLSAGAAQPVTVDFETTDGTAVAGVDYQAASGTLTFAPGETTKHISVEVRPPALSGRGCHPRPDGDGLHAFGLAGRSGADRFLGEHAHRQVAVAKWHQ
jgi:hypothetical protein